jgi:hypothetical protein
MIEMYPQTPRPWPKRRESTAPRPSTIVWAVVLTPQDDRGEALRKTAACIRLARELASSQDVLSVSVSRSAVQLVLAQPDFADIDAEIADLVRGAIRSAIGWQRYNGPDDWDALMPGAERAARQALASLDQHQCQGRDYCVCGNVGTQYPQPVGANGEIGTVVAAGGRL